MKIFLSWSGPRSKQVALALREWLVQVIQSVDPWMSSFDLYAGKKWFVEIGRQLNQCSFGVVCVTPENQQAPWLLFEAGALAKQLDDDSFVVPYLLGLEELAPGPLAQFQAKTAKKEGTRELLVSINSAFKKPLSPQLLDDAFKMWWPRLQKKLDRIPAHAGQPGKPDHGVMIEEILLLTRQIAAKPNPAPGPAGEKPTLSQGSMVDEPADQPFAAKRIARQRSRRIVPGRRRSIGKRRSKP